MRDERFLNRCCHDNLEDVADTTRLKVTVRGQRQVSSKQSDSKTRSIVAAIRAAALRTIFSKAAFSVFSCLFYFMSVAIV